MGSSNESGSGGTQGLGTLSLAPIFAAQLFGLPTGTNRGGGLTIGPQNNRLSFGHNRLGDPFFSQVFSPEQFVDSIRAQATPQERFLSEGGLRSIGTQAEGLLTSIIPGIQELSETGFGDQIAELSSFLFENDIAPEIEEQLGANFGLGVGDSDLGAALIREGRRSSLEAANAAIGNRILGLQLGSQTPALLAEQAQGVESLLQGANRAGSPEGQQFNFLMSLLGLDTQGGSIGRNASRSDAVGVFK